jgi:hypothetical protein
MRFFSSVSSIQASPGNQDFGTFEIFRSFFFESPPTRRSLTIKKAVFLSQRCPNELCVDVEYVVFRRRNSENLMLFGLHFLAKESLYVLTIPLFTKVVSEPGKADLHVVDERNVVGSSLVSRGPASTYLKGTISRDFSRDTCHLINRIFFVFLVLG